MASIDFTETFAALDFHDPYFISVFNKRVGNILIEYAREEMQERYDNRTMKIDKTWFESCVVFYERSGLEFDIDEHVSQSSFEKRIENAGGFYTE